MILLACLLALACGNPTSEGARRVDQDAVISGSELGDVKRDARAHLLVFSDYQCPACAELSDTLESLRRELGDSLQVLYKSYPLDRIHPFARKAAVAARCAEKQGAFELMNVLLYEHQDDLRNRQLLSLALTAGVKDSAGFANCLRSPSEDSIIAQDRKRAIELELGGTPAVILEDSLLPIGSSPADVAARTRLLVRSSGARR